MKTKDSFTNDVAISTPREVKTEKGVHTIQEYAHTRHLLLVLYYNTHIQTVRGTTVNLHSMGCEIVETGGCPDYGVTHIRL